MYLSGLWSGLLPNMDTKKTYVKEIGLRVHNLLTILNYVVNLIGKGRGRGGGLGSNVFKYHMVNLG